jgi:hypothetical protein
VSGYTCSIDQLRFIHTNYVSHCDSQQDISDPFVSPPEVDTSLVKLYDDIRITVRREAEIITAVFPNPVIVMQVFLQRVFAQSVSN